MQVHVEGGSSGCWQRREQAPVGSGQRWVGRECVNDVISVSNGFKVILQVDILTVCFRAKVEK